MKSLTLWATWRAGGLLVAVAALAASCTYHNSYRDEPTPTCPLPATVSYTTDVYPILTKNCRTACHNSVTLQGNFDMADFTQVKYWATPANGKNGVSWLVGNIRHDSGFNAMPQVGDKLSECDIALIKAWADAGAPNN